jgi:hypothetical protein
VSSDGNGDSRRHTEAAVGGVVSLPQEAAINLDTCALIVSYLDEIRDALAAVGVGLRDDAYLFSNDPAHARPWNPDWVTHQIAAAADAAGVELDIKGGRALHRQPAPRRRLRPAQHRRAPWPCGGGATTLRHHADPVPEVDRRAAAFLAKLTAGWAAQSGKCSFSRD